MGEQFGDFANSAQIIIDQFISSGEAKWLRQTGVTLLLPPRVWQVRAPSTRLRGRRYLQMSDEDPTKIPEDMTLETRSQIQEHNWQICNVTTPANYFHLLRRQVHREFRRSGSCCLLEESAQPSQMRLLRCPFL